MASGNLWGLSGRCFVRGGERKVVVLCAEVGVMGHEGAFEGEEMEGWKVFLYRRDMLAIFIGDLRILACSRRRFPTHRGLTAKK